jgi:putative copper export protein
MLSLRLLLLWVHLAGVVVWFGAIAYFLLVLRPAVRGSGMERREWYRLLREIKGRLRRVVGVALAAILLSGIGLAHARGLWRTDVWSIGTYGQAFVLKLLLVALLIGIFATALPLIERIQVPVQRGRAFVWTHAVALAIGSAAALLGLFLHG